MHDEPVTDSADRGKGGADIRDIQELLGHAALSSTEIYTHVAIVRLKEVHRRTHPARLTRDGSPASDHGSSL